jgi:hypothetical protein
LPAMMLSLRSFSFDRRMPHHGFKASVPRG